MILSYFTYPLSSAIIILWMDVFIYLFIFEPYVEPIPSLVELFIEINEYNSANFK